jgi:ankyrin repeat protein
MKTTSLILALLFNLTSSFPGSGANPKTQLQEGLFEEEVNRDLGKAMKHYRSLIAGFDTQRQFAATAIFRLGECFHKHGRTNEATAQYERILNEFADHTNIVATATIRLHSLGRSPKASSEGSGSPIDFLDKTFQDMEGISQEIGQIQAVADFIANIDSDLPSQVINAVIKDAALSNLFQSVEAILPEADQEKYADFEDEDLKKALGAANFRQLEIAWTQIGLRLDAITSEGEQRTEFLEFRYEALQESLPLVQAMIVTGGAFKNLTNSGVSQRVMLRTNQLTIASSELTAITQMIKDSPDLLNATYKGAGSPLEYAISSGLVPVARYLLNNGASIAGKTRKGGSHLALAVRSGNLAMAKLLIQVGAGKNHAHLNEALGIAAQKGFPELARHIITQKADVNATVESSGLFGTPLFGAIGAGQLATAELLLDNGAKMDRPGRVGRTDMYPIQLAAVTKLPHSPEILRLLIERGGDVKSVNRESVNSRRTALHMAIAERNLSAVKLLIAHGADVNAPDRQGATPLHFAVAREGTEYVDLLLKNKADPNLAGVTEKWHHSPAAPLAHVIYGNESAERMEIIHRLLMAGANPNLTISSGRVKSLLGYAIHSKKLKFAEQLLEHGASPKAAAEEHVLVLAIDQQYARLIPLLIAAGANVNESKEGLTPLFSAISRRDTNTVSALLQAKADPNQFRAGGETGLDMVNKILHPGRSRTKSYAVYDEIRRMLLAAGASYLSGDSDAITLLRKSNGVRWSILRKSDHPFSEFTLLETLALAYRSGNPPVHLGFPALDRIQVHRPSQGKYVSSTVDAEAIIANTNAPDFSLQWGDVIEIPEEPHRIGSEWRLTSDLRARLGNRLHRRIRLDYQGQIVHKDLYPLSPDLSRVRMNSRSPEGIEVFSDVGDGGAFTIEIATGKSTGSALPSCWLRDVIISLEDLMTFNDLTQVIVLRPQGENQKPRRLKFDMSRSVMQRPVLSMGGLSTSSIKRTGLWLQEGDIVEIPKRVPPEPQIPDAIDNAGNPARQRVR